MATISILDHTPESVRVFVPYNPAYLHMVRTVPGRSWDANAKCWLIPRKPVPIHQVIRLFAPHVIELDPALKQLLDDHQSELAAAWPARNRRLGPDDRRLQIRTPATDRRIQKISEYFERHLRIRNYSPRTIKTYKNILADFARFFNRPLPEIASEEICVYLDHLIQKRKVSASRIAQAVSALKFLYGKLYDRKDVVTRLDYPRRDKKLPNVIDYEDVIAILNAVDSPRNRLMFELMYGSGLRVSEVARIRVCDVDLNSLTLCVRMGKGRKDRVTMFSQKSMETLKKLTSNKSAEDFLFDGQTIGAPISPRTIQHLFIQALNKSGIRKKASCHTLRHSFATHLMESGTALPYIKDLLGHKDIKTTEIYAHVRRPNKRNIKSPL